MPMKPDWRILAFLTALCAAWLLFALAPGGGPRPTDLTPAEQIDESEQELSRRDARVKARLDARADIAADLRAGRLTLAQAASAFAAIDGRRRPLMDYAREAVGWVHTLSAKQVGPGVAELLEAELAEMEPAP